MMSLVDKRIISHVANLAKLDANSLDDTILSEFQHIVEMVSVFNDVDTDSIEPMAHPHDLPQPLRQDITRNNSSPSDLLSNAPAIDQDHFIVPAVIDTKDKG